MLYLLENYLFDSFQMASKKPKLSGYQNLQLRKKKEEALKKITSPITSFLQPQSTSSCGQDSLGTDTATSTKEITSSLTDTSHGGEGETNIELQDSEYDDLTPVDPECSMEPITTGDATAGYIGSAAEPFDIEEEAISDVSSDSDAEGLITNLELAD